MKFPGRIYQGKQWTYLALYNYHPDIYLAHPDSLEGKSSRLAHVTYRWGGFTRAIDLFRLNKAGEIPELKLKPLIRLNRRWIKGVDKRQDVQYKVVRGAPQELLDIAREDIRQFIRTKKGNPPAKKPQGSRVEYHNKIIPETKIQYIHPWKERVATTGKHEFVPECGNVANWDPAKGCITSLIGIENELSFGLQVVRGVYVAPWRECDICYAESKHKPLLKTIYQHDMQQLENELRGAACLKTGSDEKYGRLVKRLRFGKRTEAASKFTRSQFLQVLEVCAKTGTQGIIPTKFLEYDIEAIKLLKKTNSVVLFDQGFDEYEKGACSFGCTNGWRFEQAIRYGEAGVNSAIYLLIADPTKEPTSRDLRILHQIEKHKQSFIGTQLLPVRYKSKSLAKCIAGIEWDHVCKAHGLLESLDDSIHSFEVNAGQLIPRKFHSFWLDLIGNNKEFYRMCHHTDETTWCGGCFAKEGIIANHPRVRVKAIRTKPNRNKEPPKEKPPTATEKHQLSLDF